MPDRGQARGRLHQLVPELDGQFIVQGAELGQPRGELDDFRRDWMALGVVAVEQLLAAGAIYGHGHHRGTGLPEATPARP
jgi:hypothetical protein